MPNGKRKNGKAKRKTVQRVPAHVLPSWAKQMGPGKAKFILQEGQIGGKKLTPKQRGLFGLIASGKKPTRLSKKRNAKRRSRKKTRANIGWR